MGSYLLSHLHALGGGVVGYLIPFIFVLSIVVFFHEFGHFIVARLCRVRVLVFSIGFGPELAGFNDRHGTRWKISAIPLGGYVKFFGDENAASVPETQRLESMNDGERAESFFFQPVRKRAAIVVAGPVANFILAIVIFAAIFMIYGKQSMSARVDSVQADSAAATAGFQTGDVVLAINGKPVDDFADMQRVVSESAGDKLDIEVDRKGTQLVLQATPALKEIKDNFGNVHRIGILGISRSMDADDMKFQPVSPPQAVVMGAQETWFIAELYRRRRCRPRIGRPARRPGPDRADFGSGGEDRLRRPDPSRRRALGIDRVAESVPDPAARWRSSFVLFDRSNARPSALGTSAGGWVSHRSRDRRHVDDICNFQ
jgi:regulator of sigma E protease